MDAPELDAMGTPEFEFELVRCLGGADSKHLVWLARRFLDGEEFLAVADPDLGHFYASGGAANTKRSAAEKRSCGVRLGSLLHARDGQVLRSLLALLNHPNLISLAGVMNQRDPTLVDADDDGSSPNMTYFVWDNPDAGTLAANMSLYTPPPRKSRSKWFMPEAMCWHVLRSLLRAIAYLHDGQYFCVDRDADPDAPIRSRLTSIDRDWMPILHRDINEENIWLQHPRGRELYGPVKLGGLDVAAVTAHIVGSGNFKDGAGGFAVAPPLSSKGPPESLAEMRVKTLDTNLMPKKTERPYLVRDDIHAIGAVIFKMMTGFTPPPSGLCEYCETYHLRSYCRRNGVYCDDFGCDCVYGGCEHVPLVPSCEPEEGSVFDKAIKAADKERVESCPRRGVCVHRLELGRTRYTSYLRIAVSEMMWRDPVLSELDASPETPHVRSVLEIVEGGYKRWRRSTAEGQNTVDIDYHMARAWRQQRLAEWEKKKNVQQRTEMAKWGAENTRARVAWERKRDLEASKHNAALREQHRDSCYNKRVEESRKEEEDRARKQMTPAEKQRWEDLWAKARRKRKRERAARRAAGDADVSDDTTDASEKEWLRHHRSVCDTTLCTVCRGPQGGKEVDGSEEEEYGEEEEEDEGEEGEEVEQVDEGQDADGEQSDQDMIL